MELDGGIELYMRGESRYLNGESPYGRKVRYLQENGWDSDVSYANTFMKKGEILTVKEIYVDRSSSEVEFIEIPDARFNTVMFEDVEETLILQNGSLFEATEEITGQRAYRLENGDVFTSYGMVLEYRDEMLYGVVEKPNYVKGGLGKNMVKLMGSRLVYTGIEFTFQEYESVVKWLDSKNK